MGRVISKLSLGEQFLAEMFANPEKIDFHEFHAEVPYLKMDTRIKPKEKAGFGHLKIVYYNCAHCNTIARPSCFLKHRHKIGRAHV